MENKDVFVEENEDKTPDTAPEDVIPVVSVPEEPLTALHFEIAEDEGPTFTVDADITPELHEEKAEKTDSLPKQPEEEFSIPDSFEINERYNTESFVETPAGIRPTYLPRFTEVSDTYRMQDDPRPRSLTKSPTVSEKVEVDLSTFDDPTAETVDDKEVEKVIVTQGVPVSRDFIDESITVLKFSTPIDTETRDAAEVFEEHVEEEPAAEEPVAEQILDEIPEEAPEIKEISAEDEPKEIPDPESGYRVVEFTSETVDYDPEEPLGATEPVEKAPSHEFTSPIQRDSVKDRFLDTLMSIKVRMAGAIILLAAMVLIDVLAFFGINAYEYFGLANLPGARAFVDMQFSVCLFLLAIPEAIRSIRLIFKKKASPELFVVAALPAVIVCDVVLAISGGSVYVTLGVLYGLQCLVAIVSSYLKTSADFESFRTVSRNSQKNILDKRYTRELPRENLALDGAVDEYSSKTARMFRTAFVSGFFRRSSDTCENSSNVLMMLGVGAGLSLVTGFVSFFLNSFSAVCGLQSFATVFLLSLPAFSVLSHKLPYKHTVKEAACDKGAFVGEASLYDGSDIDVVTYEDTEIFGTEDVSIQKVHLYGKVYNTPKAMKQMYALFSVVGGPLDFVFSSSLDRKCPPAIDIIIEDDGISGMMDGHRISAGTEAFMIRHGISIPSDDYRTNTSTSGSTRIMYGAEDGDVYVKFFIRYSFSEEFTMLLPELKDKKIIPLVYTRDPNITCDLVKTLTLGEDIMRVMKKYVPRTTEEKTYRHVDSGIVTHGDKTNAINLVLLSKKYTAFESSLAVAELISMIVGATLAVVISIGEMFTVPASMLALWQIAWCVVLFVRSKLTFGTSVTDKDRGDEEY